MGQWLWRCTAGTIAASLLAFAAYAGCSEAVLDARGPGGTLRFDVEIADTPEARSQGLMHRESLPRFAGMLFVFESPQRVAFWMKNTLIPLDLIFVGPDGRVLKVHENAIPGDLTQISGPPGVLAVLEINGGLAQRLRIAPGWEFRHPAFAGDGAAWPCDD